ncbi:MAG TPA: hypothetical protein VK578_24485 [Edaphobacter sp.]|nr:hypothetical protein [Edaphobacter sp.]
MAVTVWGPVVVKIWLASKLAWSVVAKVTPLSAKVMVPVGAGAEVGTPEALAREE